MMNSAISDWKDVMRGTIEGSSSAVERRRGGKQRISALELNSPR